MIALRVALPAHLRELARVGAEIRVSVPSAPSIADVLDAIELEYPSLRGTIRDQTTAERRPYMRYLACGEDLSHLPHASGVPDLVVSGVEPFRIVGAIAGGAS